MNQAITVRQLDARAVMQYEKTKGDAAASFIFLTPGEGNDAACCNEPAPPMPSATAP
ncbi:MAG: hypothetical protein J2P41_09260 [Blastocatellia bacterium]|nr:hypothetical protein [Blastocatellia bacterium]